ncbi:MAG TPA: hypothetical protein GYA06_09025 [Chloroflexi bacterium]|jgi:hypothetical protein|nr:hypothetical protein [Chloroflexota bacterium]HPO58854.1 cytochrome C oxidase subunit IV family protein [Anaerolineaceae bacterium]
MHPNGRDHKAGGLQRGVMVLVVLAVLTAIEYFAATMEWPVLLLWIIALGKAGTVLWFFMHIGKLFLGEEEETGS